MKIRKQAKNNVTAGQQGFLKRQRRRKILLHWSRSLLFTGFLLFWQIAADAGWIDSFYFSSPTAISALFLKDIQNLSLLEHIGVTLWESVVSFLLIIGLSLLTASLFWFLPSLGHTFEPFLIVLNSLPKSALAPLIIVWLGTGSKTIILCGMSVGIFGCILNLYQVFIQTDAERLKLITTLGGNRLQAFTKVVFPGSLPTFLTIARTNIGLALVGVIIGEFLAGRRGLGYLIIYGEQVFKLDLLIMSIVILCAIAMLLYWLLSLLERKLLQKLL